MVAQVAIWSQSADFRNWVGLLANKDLPGINKVANTSIGPNLAVITTLTIGTAVACAWSPLGRGVTAATVGAWNGMVAVIQGMLPSGVTLVINGIRIIRI